MASTPRHNRRRWRRRAGWPLVALGVLLFAYGYIGATTGLVSLPFDRHHVASSHVQRMQQVRHRGGTGVEPAVVPGHDVADDSRTAGVLAGGQREPFHHSGQPP